MRVNTDSLQVAAVAGAHAGQSRFLLSLLFCFFLGISLLPDPPLLLVYTNTSEWQQWVRYQSPVPIVTQGNSNAKANISGVKVELLMTRGNEHKWKDQPHVWPGAPYPSQRGPSAVQPSQHDVSPAGSRKQHHTSYKGTPNGHFLSTVWNSNW